MTENETELKVSKVLEAEDPKKAAYDLGWDDWQDDNYDANPFDQEEYPELWKCYNDGWTAAEDDDRDWTDDEDWEDLNDNDDDGDLGWDDDDE